MRIGTMVRVVGNTCGHQFKIGTVAEFIALRKDGCTEFTGINREGYFGVNNKWFMKQDDFVILDKQTIKK